MDCFRFGLELGKLYIGGPLLDFFLDLQED